MGIDGRGITVAVVDSGLWGPRNLKMTTQGEFRILEQYDACGRPERGRVLNRLTRAHADLFGDRGVALHWQDGVSLGGRRAAEPERDRRRTQPAEV